MVSRWLRESGARSLLFCGSVVALTGACGDDGSSQTTETGSTSVAGSSTGPDGTTAVTPLDSSSSSTDATTSSSGEPTTSTGMVDSSSGEPATDSGSESSGGNADCHPILKEVFYDVDGPSDDMYQWVALYNPCASAIDLSTYTIAYAGEDWATWFKPLADAAFPMVDAGGCFVVGGPLIAAKNGDPDMYGYSSDFSPGLFRDEMFGGGVALFDLPEDQIMTDTVPLDVVIYGPNNDHMLMDGTGAVPADAFVPHPAPGGSVQRMAMGDVWGVTLAPQPDDCPGF